MKTLNYLSVVIFTCFLAGQVSVNAQQPGAEIKMEHGQRMEKGNFGNDHSRMGLPNLTDDQKTKMKDLRLAHMKEVQPLQNQLGELRAKQRTLTTAEKPDMKLINANIDEITKVQSQLMKSQAQMKQQIRALLTDEQRIAFDNKNGKRMGPNKGKTRMHKGLE